MSPALEIELKNLGIAAACILIFANALGAACPEREHRLQALWADLSLRLAQGRAAGSTGSTGSASAASAVGDHREVYRRLTLRYCEPHRAYHTLAHVEHVLEEFDGVRGLAEDEEVVELALWFHDVVYDLGSRQNEEDSARLAREAAIQLGLGEARANRVSELILATRHGEVPENGDARLVIDIDLSILGQPPERFDAYEIQIRSEYDPVIEERGTVAFNAGRAAILRRFLDRPAIYSTEHFRARYERTARANLQRSIERLESPSWTEPANDGKNRSN